MGNLVDLVAQLGGILGIHLPTWVFPVAVVALTLAMLPARMRGERANRALRMLLRSSAAGSVGARDVLEAEALREVRDDPHGLLTIAGWAVERGRYPLARTVLANPKLTTHPERRKLLAKMAAASPLDTERLIQQVLRE